ncbi:sensor histidine kinase [Noviherbaspirillum galbum]|uniref:Sensor histidine kinase n=1 Tax=Noviherbaspirillum galbum TaxID=2709383 RepID=A0A6B3SI72_9BURK|nr:histidine kinase [Noviherbaspirillum galbum]NEX60511.1 sensor histidine kinase [Noviherbaspirillum galbum]
MSPLDLAHPHPRLRRFAIDFVITCVIDLVIAMVITYVVHPGGSLWGNFLVSFWIGAFAVTIIDGGRLLFWGLGRPSMVPFVFLLLGGMVFSQQAGTYVALSLLGETPERLSRGLGDNVVGYFLITLLVGISITWFFWNRGTVALLRAQAEAEKARAASIEKQALQAQLQMLQAQVEPHMLFNTLANLQGLIAIDPPRAQQLLDQLIQYLRATLSSSRTERTSLAQEFILLEAYLSLMQARMGARLSHALDLPHELGSFKVPPMLLQPLVENAIKHGLEPKVEGGSVSVRARREDGMLVLTVADTGRGLDAPAQDGTRVGVANLRERLQVLYDSRASFTLEPNAPEGAIATLRIPA